MKQYQLVYDTLKGPKGMLFVRAENSAGAVLKFRDANPGYAIISITETAEEKRLWARKADK